MVGMQDSNLKWSHHYFDLLKAGGKAKTIAFLVEESPHPKEVAAGAIPKAKEIGLRVVGEEHVSVSTQDFTPILNKVNKIRNTVEDTGIASSDLQPGDMVSRPVERDTHKLIGEEVVGNRSYYMIESTPKKAEPSYPYGKLVKWITKDTFLKERIDYYDPRGKLLKTQYTTWKPIKDAWVWEKVVINNAQTGTDTFLSINDIKTDVGLQDGFFSERSMKQGVDRLP